MLRNLQTVGTIEGFDKGRWLGLVPSTEAETVSRLFRVDR